MVKSGFYFGALRVPCLMGVVNVTPNSFSDGGEFLEAERAVARGRALAEAGAGIVDSGAEASSFFRPGVAGVEAEEQMRRLGPVIPRLSRLAGVVVSVDTRSAAVARQAVEAGATIINDISAGTHDSALLETVAELNAAIILMHIGEGYPATPRENDGDIVSTVRDYLAKRIAVAMAAGISRDRIAVDPGIGFGKTMEDNWTLALRCNELAALQVPVVLGASRKRFLETPFPPATPSETVEQWARLLSQVEALDLPPEHPRDYASAALTALAAKSGVPIHRVHHVTLAARALTL